MIAEMIIWGFFSACGWFTANWVKDQVWPELPAQQAVEKSESGVNTQKGTPNEPGQ
jgi:hypothetical protein